MKYLFLYLVLLNMIGILIMYVDKTKAKKKAWRIPEKTLFLVSVLGGSIGIWMGMYIFHHKTKHLRFVIGVPMIILIQIMICLYCEQ